MAKTGKKANPLLEEDEEMETKKSKTAKPAAKKAAKKAVKEVDDEDVEETDEDADEDEDEQEEEETQKPVKSSKQPAKVDIRAALLNDIEMTKAKLEKQPKVRFFIPLGIGEVAGTPSAVESVTINGYRQVFPKGKFIEVPQGVADILEQHYNMTPENTEMGRQFRLDRARTHDGFSTDDALNV